MWYKAKHKHPLLTIIDRIRNVGERNCKIVLIYLERIRKDKIFDENSMSGRDVSLFILTSFFLFFFFSVYKACTADVHPYRYICFQHEFII